MKREGFEPASFAAERQELEAFLSLGVLDPNSNPGRLLRYLCEKRFAGCEEDIKEYNIAVDVFGRPPGFDSRRNSAVRVEASRLRKRLDEYYGGAGRSRPLRISIPPGQYVPQFSAPPEVGEGGDVARHSLLSFGRLRWIILGMLLLVLGVVAALRQMSSPAAPAAEDAPALAGSPAATPNRPTEVRILAGYEREKHVDRAGNVWLGDRYFSGGHALPVDPPPMIARTFDSTIYKHMRTGPEFSYRIPLAPGHYELRLHFAETVFGEMLVDGGGETSRLMIIRANGRILLYSFDVYAEAGGSHTAVVRVFRDIQPAEDGFLHLDFSANWDRPFLNAIEVLPSTPGQIRPVRIVARDTAVTDSAGRVWHPDNYSSGGRLVLRKATVAGTPDPDLYLGERYGRFSYAIPVARGTYRLTLHFAETWHKTGAGKRAFDVWCNGKTLLDKFDIAREAGGPQRAIQKTFRGIQPTSSGKIELSFVPVVNYACVNAIEVVDETN